MYSYSVERFKKMWLQVGEEIGMRWNIEAELGGLFSLDETGDLGAAICGNS